jgi:hypothetical protein
MGWLPVCRRLTTSDRAVSFRHDSRGAGQCRASARWPRGGVIAVRCPRSHAGTWFPFWFPLQVASDRTRNTPHSSSRDTRAQIADNRLITARSAHRSRWSPTSLSRPSVCLFRSSYRESNHAVFVSCATTFRRLERVRDVQSGSVLGAPKVIKITRWIAVSQAISSLEHQASSLNLLTCCRTTFFNKFQK